MSITSIEQLRDYLDKRIRNKIENARKAFVSSRQAKRTLNCINAGSKIGGKESSGIHHCKITALGEYEISENFTGATCCWDQKAGSCPLFEKRSTKSLTQLFYQMSVQELCLRYPSIGELLRLSKLLKCERDEVHNGERDSITEIPQTGVREDTGSVRSYVESEFPQKEIP